QFVAALFRHGVRAPLQEFATHSNDYSGQCWPGNPADWGAEHWGDLTTNGKKLATRVGEYYADRYRPALPSAFRAFVWAELDARTRDTAQALADGLHNKGVPRKDITVAFRAEGDRPTTEPDPLFHPFKAECGTPDRRRLDTIARFINAQWADWAKNE